jgi:hypothetical protein
LEHGTTLLFGLAGVAVREVNLHADGTPRGGRGHR